MTNADKIRSMTDEELAEFIKNTRFDCEYNCVARDKFFNSEEDEDCIEDCQGYILKWLKLEMQK